MNSAGTDSPIATSNQIFFDGVRYVSAGEIAAAHGYVRDWVARLARQGNVRGRLLGNIWYVDEQSFAAYRRSVVPTAQFANDANAKHHAHVESAPSATTREIYSDAVTVSPPTSLHDRISRLRTRAARRALVGKTISTTTLALALTVGVSALAAPDVARTTAADAQAQLAAAAADPGGFLAGLGDETASLARSFAASVDDFIVGVAIPNPTLTYYRAQGDIGGNIRSTPPPASRARMAMSAATTSVAASLPSSPHTTTIIQRIVEQLPTAASQQLASANFVTRDELDSNISALGTSLRQLIFQNISAPSSLPSSGG